MHAHFYAPGLKGRPGASRNWIVRLSIHNTISLANKVQNLKFVWSYNNQTWSLLVHLRVAHTSLTSQTHVLFTFKFPVTNVQRTIAMCCYTEEASMALLLSVDTNFRRGDPNVGTAMRD